MSRVLVTYATKHGATTEIAQAITDELRHAGHEADCLQVDHIDTFDGYDAAVVGSAVYMKRWRPEARRFLKRQARALAERPFWIFSSGPCGEKPDPSWSEPRRTIARAERMGARGHVVFGGRLPTEPSNFMERSMVDACPPEHRDRRDWDAIRAWAGEIGIALKAGPRTETTAR